jgi:hypothetical protein
MVNYSLYSVMHKTSSVCLFLFVCCTSSLSILLIIDNKEQIHLIHVFQYIHQKPVPTTQ